MSLAAANFWLVSEGELPIFLNGATYEDHVREWRIKSAVIQCGQWALAAIAASVDRSWGGSPRREAAMQQTGIQKFCQEVDIGRNDFQRLSHTYKAFARTCTTGGTRFNLDLPFKTYEVAGRLAKDDPVAAINEAVEKGWSANELERQLEERKGKPPFSLPEELAKLRAAIFERIASWPEAARPAAIDALHELGDDLAARELPALSPEEFHAIRWIIADLENIPFVKHTFNEGGLGRGGDLEIVPGAAGAPIYQAIVGNVTTASRARVIHAAKSLLDGKVTPTGQLVLGIARDLAAGDPDLRRLMVLHPSAGGDGTGTLFETRVAVRDDDDLPDFLQNLTPDFTDPIGLREEEALTCA